MPETPAVAGITTSVSSGLETVFVFAIHEVTHGVLLLGSKRCHRQLRLALMSWACHREHGFWSPSRLAGPLDGTVRSFTDASSSLSGLGHPVHGAADLLRYLSPNAVEGQRANTPR